MVIYFTEKDDDNSIEEYLAKGKCFYENSWRYGIHLNLLVDAYKRWRPLNHDRRKTLLDQEFEQVFLDKWDHAMKKDNARPNGLSSSGISIL